MTGSERDSGKDRGEWPTEELPRAWAWASFGAAFSNETTSDKKLAQASYDREGPLAVVDQGQATVAGYTNDANLRHPSPLPVVVFGDHTRCVKFVDFPFVQGADGVKVLRPREVLDARFAFHALRAVAVPDRGYARHYKFLSATKFPVPPLNEQRRIVAKLESLQARSRRAREALDAVPPLLEKLRQSILAAAFRGDLTKDWRAKNKDVEPASELLKRIRVERRKKWEEGELAKMRAKGREPGDERWKEKYKEPQPANMEGSSPLPEGWCWASVEELSMKVADGVHKKPHYVPSGIPFLTVKNLTAGPGISFESLNYVSQEDHEEFVKRTDPELGDILISKDGTLGVTRLIRTETIFSIFVSLALVKPALRSMGEYLESAFLSPFFQERFKSTGSGLLHIHLVDLRAAILPVAPLAEQPVVTARAQDALRQLDTLVRRHSDFVDSIASLDRAMLVKAFRGELVPQDPSDEPAEAMLARLRDQHDSHAADALPSGRGRKRKTV